MPKLPPLNAIRAFEAAARHLSFVAAAQELGVTSTAISHQIRLLEETLGQALFRRQPRPLSLTESGARLIPTVRDGFERIAAAFAEAQEARPRLLLRLTATTAFAGTMLLPGLRDWTERNPGIEIEIAASDHILDLAAGAADAAVRYCRAPESNLIAEPMGDDHYAPMLAPAAFPVVDGGKMTPEAILGLPLIAHRWKRSDPMEPRWERWRDAALIAGARPRCLSTASFLRFSEESHALEAAAAGEGVALASYILSASRRSVGSLAVISNLTLPGLSYFLVYPPHLVGDCRIEALRDWLAQIMGPRREFDELSSSRP